MPFTSTIQGMVQRLKNVRTYDGNARSVRLSSYGELHVAQVVEPRNILADEGSFFTAVNPTVGTGIAPNALETAFADTRGFFVVANTGSPSDILAKSVYLDALKLMLLATAPTATVAMQFAGKRSQVSREPTTAANRTLLTAVNMVSDGPASVARVMSYANAGAMTVPAAGAADPVLFRAQLATSLGIAGDQYILKFGANDFPVIPGATAVRAAAPAQFVLPLPPVVLRPGDWFVLHRWWLTEATNAPNFEFELSWYER